MTKAKKLFFSILVSLVGLLLVLAGFNLIELSQTLVLYTGIGAFVIAVLLYFFIS